MQVPAEYFSSFSSSQTPSDRPSTNPELVKGVYEFWANSDYNPRPVNAISYMVAIEMTPASLNSGIF